MLGQWEWIILLVLVLALLVWELARTRRAIARARTKEAPTQKPGPD